MNRPTRLVHLVQMLAGRRSRSIDEIAEQFGISQRTAYRDIADLSRQNIPVMRDRYGYRLLDGTTIRPLALTAEEFAALRRALSHPALLKTPKLVRTLKMVEAKLEAASTVAEEE